jgi:RNA polymerase sigma factor (sigma-70 family)
MLRLLKPANPEDLFVERYEVLLGWALSLTNHNQAQAEDLVHDAFIQFTHRRGDLAAIENADAYLNRMLRNMYLSQVRRASLIHNSRFSIADFDSLEMGLRSFRANDPREHLDLQDELRQICEYACARKETSKAGSVLILRFFHGYYPSEILQVLRTTRMAVDRWLQISRREAKTYLADPASLKFMAQTQLKNTQALGYARTTPELIGELRESIFAARGGDCLAKVELRARYQTKTTIDSTLLSHLVSCAHCLDEVNQLLGMPQLAERGFDERLGRDVPPSDSGGGGQGGSGVSIVESKKRYQRREKEVMEHRPQELRIAVNGFVLGSQQVSSEVSKLALTVKSDEPIGFVEVFSEQGVRMLFFDVDQPTEGSIEQTAGVDFDCGRALDLSLSFRGPWPALNVSYQDPTFEAVENVAHLEIDSVELDEVGASAGRREWPLFSPMRTWLRSLVNLFDGRLFLRPGVVTALVALVLIASLLLLYRRTPIAPLSAATLLQRATDAEQMIAANRDQVTHRTLKLEERSSAGDLLASRRVELWRSAEKGITARRLYDDKDRLIAGDWRRSDGVQTIYHHGARPQLQLAPEKRSAQSAVTFENAWQLDLAAKDFSSLISGADRTKVEEQGNVYVISADVGTASGSDRVSVSSVDNYIASATLVLNRRDLHPVEERIVVRQGNETREYRFIETGFEQKAKAEVSPSVFEPEKELLSSTRPEIRNSKLETAAPAPGLRPLAPVVATADDEVEVLRLLNQAGVFLRDQVSVVRAPAGQLIVSGVVETDERKQQIAKALSPVVKTRVARVEVETLAEVLQRQQARATSQPVTIEGGQVTESHIPVDAELRKYLSSAKELSGEQLDTEMRRFGERILARSNQARLHALALKPIIERFSPEELQALTPEARSKWRSIVVDHVRSFALETAALRRELEPLFPSLANSVGIASDVDVASDAGLVRSVRRLMQLAGATDAAVRDSFSSSVNGNRNAPVKSPQFWRSLASSEAFAAKINKQ